MTSLTEEISRTLNIYKRNYTEYTKCLVRGKEIILDGRPEEKVRQFFIYFLVNKSGLFPNKIEIKVESDHHDIELYKIVKNKYFKPYCPPLMIVEVKREEENLRNHEKQIEKWQCSGKVRNGKLVSLSAKSTPASMSASLMI